jgi:SAM-dependent methyltransferase
MIDQRHRSIANLVPQSEKPRPNRLNVGCGRHCLPEWVNLDMASLPGVDVVADLEQCRQHPLPFPDDHFDELLLSHVLEHIRDPLGLMQELHRIAKPGARALIRIPYGSSDDAFEDPTHVRQYFLASFGYFSQPFYWRADYGYGGDWQVRQIDLIVEREAHQGMTTEQIFTRIRTLRNVVLEMVAVLEAIKPIRAAQRELQTNYRVNITFPQK